MAAGPASSSPASQGPLRQRTLGRPVTLEGRGLHSGAVARVHLYPAEEDTGIVFQAGTGPDAPRIQARLETVAATSRGVALAAGGAQIATVEHLLSACAGMGVDNLRAVVEGGELPAGDGSARIFVEALARAGVVEQTAPRAVLAPPTPVWVGEGRSALVALPHAGFRATYVVEHPVAGVQVAEFDGGAGDYAEAVAGARTWGNLREAEALRCHGLALGASLENTLVIADTGYVNAPRYPDELARHKLLDLIGDLALLGAAVRAHVIALRGGHALHVALAWRIREECRGAPGTDPGRGAGVRRSRSH